MALLFKKDATLLPKPKIVIFDWDDTLIKSGHLFETLFETVMTKLEVPESSNTLRNQYRHYSLRESFPKIFGDKWEEAKVLYYKTLQEMDTSHIEVMEGAAEVLKYLADQNVIMTVVSNKNGPALRKEVKQLDWEQYFHKVVGAMDAKRDKPWPEPAESAIIGLPKPSLEKIWFVGDSMVDVHCASNMGCQSVLFGQSDIHLEAERAKIPYLHVKDHKELIESYKSAQ